jgi:hypothetical protein
MTIIHLIWKGKGWQVIAVTFGCSLIAELLTRLITHDDNFYQINPYPLPAALAVASLIIYFLYKNIKTEEEINFNTNPKSQNKSVGDKQHSFFFIPMKYWSLIILCCGIITLMIKIKSY